MEQLKRWKSIFESKKQNTSIIGSYSIHLQEAVIFAKNTLYFLKEVFYRNIKINTHTFFRLQYYFKKYRIEFNFDDFDNSNKLCLGGNFDEETKTITVFINKNVANTYEQYYTLDTFWKSIEEVIGHELVHKIQFYKRQFIKNVDNTSIKTQLKRKEEIMAYSWQCVDLFMLYGLNKSEALKSISDYNNINRYNNIILMNYYHYFNNSDKKDRYVLKLFIKYVYEYIQKMMSL